MRTRLAAAQIPVLKTAGGCIFESNAIARYGAPAPLLRPPVNTTPSQRCNSLPRCNHGPVARTSSNKVLSPYPAGSAAAARVDAWIDFSSTVLDGPIYPFTRQLRGIDPYNKQVGAPARTPPLNGLPRTAAFPPPPPTSHPPSACAPPGVTAAPLPQDAAAAAEALKKALAQLDSALQGKTFLEGESLTLAGATRAARRQPAFRVPPQAAAGGPHLPASASRRQRPSRPHPSPQT